MKLSTLLHSLLAKLCCARFIALTALLLLGAGQVQATYIDKTISSGKVRIHYDSSSPTACDAVLLGVGTAMSPDGYDKLSDRLISYGYVVVILDHAPGNPFKTDATLYASLAQDVKTNLISWIPDSNCESISHWVLGGHSAGGQAAQEAISNDSTLADAVFSIDPFDSTTVGNVNVPAMYWGFDVTTCFVDKDKAAKAAYYRSNNLRAFYKVAKKYSWGPCGYSPKYFHCSFCDGHCPACTNCKRTPDHFFDDVGASVNKFITVVFYGSWSKSALTINATTPLTLYTDGDQP
ncbi:hypothetical protein [Oceanicoccus sp. KOV_DT_Chl]|uniref:hypothetical protein n=1 Tax=Oceanicoccus sp. KOV_DT_Chl TaxID=1904639 RepID=UPI000C7C4E66|nr:hypothetical protein [Oceanicoccus sp. KOV_DT_Chl]